ncbi:MAG TPA: penicillin-binding transpeptidase domain-containing protein, partial [Patescibacteria group bacterium]|nr:penicillin-binding transpeptidase domain-containing protein [Patescibacteria group bacterium]
EPTNINIPGEAQGIVPSPAWKKEVTGEVWYPGDNYNYGIGQGYLLVSPLQLAGSIAAISNGGRLYQPILVKEVRDNSNLAVSRDNPILKRADIADPGVLKIVKDGMKKACTLFVNLAGDTGCKTGSAEFGNDEVHGWFVAFAPWEKPEIVLSVLVEGGGHGSQVAAPITRPILQKYLKQ